MNNIRKYSPISTTMDVIYEKNEDCNENDTLENVAEVSRPKKSFTKRKVISSTPLNTHFPPTFTMGIFLLINT